MRWKQIGTEDYLISEEGIIVSSKRRTLRELKHDTSGGYHRVTLSTSRGLERYLVHRLVAQSFIPNPHNLSMVNHKDGNKNNNHVNNLEWCTCQQNTIHAFNLNLRKSTEDHPNTTRKNEDIHRVCEMIQNGFTRGDILKANPSISKSCFDDIRSRRTWTRVSKMYTW